MKSKLEELQILIKGMEKPLVAYSGGVDSSLLLYIAHDLLGHRAAGLIVKSPTLPLLELEEARNLAHQQGWRLLEVETNELDLPHFTANTTKRCYFCKDHRFRLLNQYADQHGFSDLLDGSNADDLEDFRPGQQAAQEQGVRSPLQEVGFTKKEIRDLAHELDLPNWNKPAAACLASRIPYGVPITLQILSQVSQAESILSTLGFRQLRVRHHGPIARIEVPAKDFKQVLTLKDQIVHSLEGIGYTYITLDLSGFQSGSMNKGFPKHG